MATAPLNMAIRLNGVDATAGAFDSVAARATNVARRMTGLFKLASGAFAAIGATATVKGALNDMTALHDLAQQAGVSSAFLQQFAGAMAQAGVTMGQQDIVTSVQKLNAALVNTEKIAAFEKLGIDVRHLQGLKPEKAFLGFLDVVSRLPDEQLRLLALQRGLEEQGLRLAPLMRLGPDAFAESLQSVMQMIPAARESTVNTATDVNNALTWVADSFRRDFWEALGSVLGAGTETFGGLDVMIAGLYESFKLLCANAATLFEGLWRFLSSGWDTFSDNLLVSLANLGAKIQNARDAIAAGIANWYGERYLGWEAGGDEMQGVESARAALEAQRNGLIETVSAGSLWAGMAAQFGANASDFEARMQKVTEGFAAKAKLTALTPATLSPLSESIESAVTSGVEKGLAEGVESGSYAVLKNAFKARALTSGRASVVNIPQAPAGAVNPPTVGAHAAPAVSNTPATKPARNKTLEDLLTVAKHTLEELRSTNRKISALGTF